MTPGDRAEVQKMIQQAILEERERVAKAAGMASSGEPGSSRWMRFAAMLRGKEGE